MIVDERCAQCMYDKEIRRTDHPEYIAAIESILNKAKGTMSAPYVSYLFEQEYRRFFGEGMDYRPIKKQYNDLVLSMEAKLKESIRTAEDPFRKALGYSRTGNYIDFGALDHVDEETFLSLFAQSDLREEETAVYEQFRKECKNAQSFLLVADNCGEIVLDRFFLEELKHLNPLIQCAVMVRGGETVNDAAEDDAVYAGIDRIARIISSGKPIPGCVVSELSPEALDVFLNADVVLAKGQGNYEALGGCGRMVYYSFLCKCDKFAQRFDVPRFTGMLVRENGAAD